VTISRAGSKGAGRSAGRFDVRTLDPSGSPAGSGAPFGLAVAPEHQGAHFVDGTNTLERSGAPTPSAVTAR
jgi:hypothetical protein